MTENWFRQQRSEWISETLRVFGFLNRGHIQKKFGISVQQASDDLSRFLKEYPDAMTYNKNAKRFESNKPQR